VYGKQQFTEKKIEQEVKIYGKFIETVLGVGVRSDSGVYLLHLKGLEAYNLI